MEFFHSSSRKITKTVSIIILGTLSAKTFFQYGFSVFFSVSVSLSVMCMFMHTCASTHTCVGGGVYLPLSPSLLVFILNKRFTHFILS